MWGFCGLQTTWNSSTVGEGGECLVCHFFSDSPSTLHRLSFHLCGSCDLITIIRVSQASVICKTQHSACFGLLDSLDCRTARCGEVESSDGGLAHDGMHISVMSKLPGGYLTSSDCWWVEHSGLQTLEGHWPHVSPTERRSQSLAKT